ncbi:hypothetical protein QSH57_011195 [Fusarium oxysporum f. sp. vasinfectum]|nr:hypothetical protein QSH57_011195 [Fusarium oxysporum f. sp. vasinfectum]
MNSQPNGAGPAQSRESYKHSMEEWRQSALAQRNQYEPRVKEQVTRYFQEYSPPFYASVIGYRRDWNLLVATSRVSGFAATLGRDLEDVEAKAIAEYTLDNIHTNAGLKWLSVALAGYMTYRGRRTWQFPFYKPKLGGRFNPNEATSIFTNKKIRGAYPRATWHCLRFTAYSAVIMLMIEPAFRAVSFIRTEAAMTNDPRLKQFTKDAAERVKDVMSNPTISRAPFTVSSPAGSAWERIRQQSQGPTQQSDYQSRTWAAHSQTGSRQESQSGWGSRSAGSSSDSFSFSKSDEERAVAKEQAQDEFDRLVERERKGVDQEKAWGRK